MRWVQSYDPLHNQWLSTLAAALPVFVLLGSIAWLKVRIHFAALAGLALALVIAVGIYRMPADVAAAASCYGIAFGLFPIGWIILNVIFLYELTVRRGLFGVLRDSLAQVAPDPRIQVILIAFCFGALIEGMAGFGAPVAVTAAILIQLGFKPLQASGLALIANTAPVAFGSLGIPITTLEAVTGLDAKLVSAMVGRQLPLFSLLIPFWVVAALAGWRGVRGIWPAALTAGLAFAVPQFLVANLHGPWLVDTISATCSLAATIVLLRFWRPKNQWQLSEAAAPGSGAQVHHACEVRLDATGSDSVMRPSFSSTPTLQHSSNPQVQAGAPVQLPVHSRRQVLQAWLPWAILTACILCWGTPRFKSALDRLGSPKFAVPHLHLVVQRTPPVAPPTAKPEAAEFTLNIFSATGTGILFAAIIAGLSMGCAPGELLGAYVRTFWQVRYSLLTIAAMLALGQVTKYCGTDATLGLALARTGAWYPFFGTLLGWLGVALTGSDTASNVLFGSLQKITAEQTGLSPILMGAANSAGGVMGKMVAAQSIVVASTATNWYGHEGRILRYVFWHSLTLAVLMGLLVFLQARVSPFMSLVVK